MKAYLDELRRKALIDDIAERFHVSTSLLCHDFKRYFEISPQAYQLHLRMHQAAFQFSDQNLH